jgi:hypothetical protein
VYHADRDRKRELEDVPSTDLEFRFWRGVDLVKLSQTRGLLPSYTIVTCHAPPNPTFAFEPSRFSQTTIQTHLRKTKGEFRKVRDQGEEMLEVFHEGRALTFPPWKFEIQGPLALLKTMASHGSLCILSAVDGEVFWETLAQLLADDRYRPCNVLFAEDSLKDVFGPIYTELFHLPIGGRVSLADLGDIRKTFPMSKTTMSSEAGSLTLRYVEIRRGAVLDEIPAGFTARQFVHMKAETPPWWIIMVPDSTSCS